MKPGRGANRTGPADPLLRGLRGRRLPPYRAETWVGGRPPTEPLHGGEVGGFMRKKWMWVGESCVKKTQENPKVLDLLKRRDKMRKTW